MANEFVAAIKDSLCHSPSKAAILSYDEKPGIQTIGNTAPDLPPVVGEHPEIARDHEYVRFGTTSLLASIDLLTGQVHGTIADRHCSSEFVDHLLGPVGPGKQWQGQERPLGHQG
jgi:hypothetical protein